MEKTINNASVLFRTRIDIYSDDKKKEEILYRWSEKEFQQLHERARCEVMNYITEMDEMYKQKNGNGFIRHLENRMKTPESICGKLERKGYPFDFDVAVEKLNDISGVRVICFCLKEIYWLVNRIKTDGRFKVLKTKDYIKHPKNNGYQSYHIILEVPIKDEKGIRTMRVEVQIRTIIMDAWASVDQRIIYKKKKKISSRLKERVKQYGKIGHLLDEMIQNTIDEA